MVAGAARRPHARLEAAGGDEDLVQGREVEREVLAPPADGLCSPSGVEDIAEGRHDLVADLRRLGDSVARA